MKTELTIISDDLNHGIIDEKQARTLLLDLLNVRLSAVAHQKIDLIKEYLEPTGITITELIDRNAYASLCQLLDAYLLEAVRNSR